MTARFAALTTLLALSAGSLVSPAHAQVTQKKANCTLIVTNGERRPGVKATKENPDAGLITGFTYTKTSSSLTLFALLLFNDRAVRNVHLEVKDAAGAVVNADNKTLSKLDSKMGVSLVFTKPGKYTLVAHELSKEADPLVVATITIADSTPPAPKVGSASVVVCKEVDDNWKPVGATTTWKGSEKFNVLITSPTVFPTPFLGIIIHKQGPEGKDIAFVDEFQQRIEENKVRKYATTEGLIALEPGTYSIYVISWYKRELLEHQGNFTDYYAKTTLTVLP